MTVRATATPPGAATPEAVTLAVIDDGIGIAPADHAVVFEPFRQAGRREGTGLGLALVQKLVALHGGQVTLVSAVGAGSTFTVTLPVLAALPLPRDASDDLLRTA